MNAEYVAAMEDVLDLYEEPYDAQRPKVNLDETSKQLIAEVRTPLPAKPGAVERVDYEYHRQGTRNLFMICEPQVGWRHVAVTEQRTMIDFAQQMKWLVDGKYPEATVIRIVMDNLNTHEPASLYEAFEPGAAHLEEVGVSPYAQAWQLVEYGRDRVECLESSMSGSSDPGCSNTEARSQGS